MTSEHSSEQQYVGVIAVVGGGSAGHVVPALPVIDELLSRRWQVHFIGTRSGFEQNLLGQRSVAFHGISAGKLRRYFDWQNFTDLGRIVSAVLESLRLLRRVRPKVLFSKGGFVSLPPVFAAWLLRIPVVAHESDFTPGLANRLAAPFVATFCTSFAETAAGRYRGRVKHTGTPIRPELLLGDADKARSRYGIGDKPILLVTGGSLGADRLNRVVRDALPRLLQQFAVVHVCGQGKVSGVNQPGYIELAYVADDWGDLLSAADIVLSRAGANALFELLTLGKLNLLVPLSAAASRGDQIANAEYAQTHGYSQVLQEHELTPERLVASLQEIQGKTAAYRSRLSKFQKFDTIALLLDEIESLA